MTPRAPTPSGPAFRPAAAALLAAGLALSTLPPSAAPAATLHYAWNACNSGTISAPWLGPGIYRQALCIDGLAADVRGVQVVIVVGPSVPDAWRISGPFGQTCEPASAFQFDGVVPGAGTASIPAVQATYTPDLTDPRWRLDVHATYDPATPPDPALSTGVALLAFDLGNARVVAQNPGECGGAAIPLCFGIAYAVATHADDSQENLVLAQDQVRWNDPTNLTGCPGSVPASPATWGSLKVRYR